MSFDFGIEADIAGRYWTCWSFFPASITHINHINNFIEHIKKAIDDKWLKELKDMGQI